MNSNAYVIEISSAAHDARFLNEIHQAQLLQAAQPGQRSSLLTKLIQLFHRAKQQAACSAC